MKKLLGMLLVLLLAAGVCCAEELTDLLARAEAGDPAAQVAVGDCYYEGRGVELNYTIAAQWYQKAAEQGYMEGQYKLGMCYYNGHGVPKNMERASYWLLEVTEKGEKYGNSMDMGIDGDDSDDVMAVSLTANPTTPNAQKQLGDRYFYGYGVARDYDEAEAWYRKAAAQGDMEAEYMLGEICRAQGGRAAEMVAHYTKAAEAGNADAQHQLGRCYAKGRGVEQDDEQAFAWYMRAAEQGHTQALLRVASCYFLGTGVAKDEDLSAYYATEAASQTDVWGKTLLGLQYFFGDGVTPDLQKAVQWWYSAAQQGGMPKSVFPVRSHTGTPANSLYY